MTSGLEPYPRSKAIAERAAWDLMQRDGGDTEFVVVPYDIANALGWWAPLRDPRDRARAFADLDIQQAGPLITPCLTSDD